MMNLNKRLDRREQSPPKKRDRKKILVRLAIAVLAVIVVICVPVRGIYQSGKNLVRFGKAVSESFQNEDFDGIRTNVAGMKKSSQGLEVYLNWMFWMRAIPYFGGYYADAKKFASASSQELEAAEVLLNSLEPYKIELGFTGHPTPGVDKVAQFIKILDKVIPQLSSVEDHLRKANDQVGDINVGKYPEKVGRYKIRAYVDTAKNLITGAHHAVTEGKSALEIAPDALGQKEAKNYLIIFQNDKEIRPTGGFMTAYAFMKFDKGRVTSSTSDDIYRLDEKLLSVCRFKICPLTPPEPIVRYLPETTGKPRTAWSMRDSNISPDVVVSMEEFERIYSLLGEGLPFDGIILIDTHVVEDLIKITGPIQVFGTTYSAQTDGQCNCPNVIYELERYAQIIERGEEDRKAILGALMQQLLARTLNESSKKLPEFINVAVKLAGEKHVMFYMHDQKVQSALSKLNWTGEIKDVETDYLHINDSNFAGGKSNLYVEREARLEINVGTDGKVKNKLTLEYKNPQPYNSWLNSINRDYVRIYVPKGSKLTDAKGSDVAVGTKEDEKLSKTYFDAFIQVRPQNSRILVFEYELPEKFSGKKYPILIQKQPGTGDFGYAIKLNGKKKVELKLASDQDLELPL